MIAMPLHKTFVRDVTSMYWMGTHS